MAFCRVVRECERKERGSGLNVKISPRGGKKEGRITGVEGTNKVCRSM